MNLISTVEICRYHNVDNAFIHALKEAGVIAFEEIGPDYYIAENELHKFERIIRLHEELEINVAGIDAINHLLDRIELLREEMRVLKNSKSKIQINDISETI